MRRLLALGLGLAFTLFLSAIGQAAEPLRVMTYNVRLPAKSDGPDFWEHRKDIAVAVVDEKDPDIFGTQELVYEQGLYFAEKLPDYAWFGRSRRGNHEDEHMGVFYKRDRLELIEEGDFWLSETPDVPGSMSWDVTLPRMVTWGLFRLKDSDERFYFLNTHFAHRREDAEARRNSARVIVDFVESLPEDVPLMLTGDFNSPADGAVHATLVEELTDAWETAAERSGPEGTFHGFTGTPRAGRRIDWVLYRAPWRVQSAESVTYNEAGRYPSDHLPVLAVFSLTE